MTFELTAFTSVKLNNLNPRTEKHGTEAVPAVDLNFSYQAANTVLEKFDKSLLASLYYKAAPIDFEAQEAIEGLEKITDLPNLRFPNLAPIKWGSKHAGYTLAIDYGLGEDRAIEIESCSLGKFTLDVKEGGTVEVKFQVQCQSGLTEQIMGKLAMMNGQEIYITLLAPKLSEELPTNVEPLFPDYKPDAKLTAEDIFTGTADAAVH